MKDIKISKELLSEVLNEKVEVVDIKTSIDDYSIPTNEIRYYPVLSTSYKSINIYEFAFKCKEWALTKGHIFNIQMSSDITLLYMGSINKDIEADTEIECIIKACEWILENK